MSTDQFIPRHLPRGGLLAELGHVLIRFTVDRGQSLPCAVKRDKVGLVGGRAGEERRKSGRRAGDEDWKCSVGGVRSVMTRDRFDQ